jgi:hypothetical protein
VVKVKNPRLLTSQPEVPVLISRLEPGVRAQTFAEHMFAHGMCRSWDCIRRGSIRR